MLKYKEEIEIWSNRSIFKTPLIVNYKTGKES